MQRLALARQELASLRVAGLQGDVAWARRKGMALARGPQTALGRAWEAAAAPLPAAAQVLAALAQRRAIVALAASAPMACAQVAMVQASVAARAPLSATLARARRMPPQARPVTRTPRAHAAVP